MNSTNDQGLLQEIEEDLARQRTEALWKRYGNTIISGAILIVLITAGVTAYKSYRIQSEQKMTHAYLDIFDKKKEEKAPKAELLASFEAFAQEHKGKTLGVFAQFQSASLALDENNKQKALDIYNAIAADQKAEPVYRQFADLMYVKTEMDAGDAKTLLARLEPLTKDGAWKFSALEFSGHLAIKSGDREKAKSFFTELKGLPEVPQNIERRASDMLIWLNKGA